MGPPDPEETLASVAFATWTGKLIYERACDYLLWMAGQQHSLDDLAKFVAALDEFPTCWSAWTSVRRIEDIFASVPALHLLIQQPVKAWTANGTLCDTPEPIRVASLLATQHFWLTHGKGTDGTFSMHFPRLGVADAPSDIISLLRPLLINRWPRR